MRPTMIKNTMLTTSRNIIGGGSDGGVDDDSHEKEKNILHTRDVSLVSSLSSFDNDDVQQHQLRQQRRISAPLRGGPIHPPSPMKSSHIDRLSHKTNIVSSEDSSLVVRRSTSSTFLEEKDNSDKKMKEESMTNTTHVILTSSSLSSPSSTLPLQGVPPIIVPTNHNNIRDNSAYSNEGHDHDDTASFYSVPHLMRTCDSQDEDEEEDDDDDVDIRDSLQEDHNDNYTDFEVDEDDFELSNINSSSSSSNSRRIIEILIAGNNQHRTCDDNTGFGTEVTMSASTILDFSSLASLSQQPHPPPSMSQKLLREQQQAQLLPPPPPQNNSSPQNTTPIVCNRRQKLRIRSIEESSNNITSNNNIDYSCIRGSVHDESNISSSNVSNKYVITFPGENNCEIEVSSSTKSSLPTLPL